MALINISGKIGSGKDTAAKMIQYLTWKEYMKNDISEFKSFEQMINEKGIPPIPNGWKVKRHADKLKQILSLVTGIPVTDFEKEEVKNTLMPDEWQVYYVVRNGMVGASVEFATRESAERILAERSNSSYGIYEIKKSERTFRWALQYMGTELFRDKFHQNFHINALYADYKIVDIEKRRSMLSAIDYSECFPKWIVSDTRFINEIEKANTYGSITIRIDANVMWWRDIETKKDFYTRHLPHDTTNLERIDAPNHQSEIELDNYTKFKYSIRNDGTLEDLLYRIMDILQHEGIIEL